MLSTVNLLVFYWKKNIDFPLEKTKLCSSGVRFVARELRRLLVEFAVEQITQFQQALSRDIPADHCVIVAADVKAMYACQCRRYALSYQLSDRIIDSLSYQNGLYAFSPTDA
jgi:hypothetical protein